MRAPLEEPEACTDHHEAEAPFGADLVNVRSLGTQASIAAEGDIETDSDDNSDPEINSVLLPASGAGSDVIPNARVKQDAAAEPEPGCILRKSNEGSSEKHSFKVPAAAQGGLKFTAELECGRDPLTDPERQGGTDSPIAASTTAAYSLGEPRRAQTDLNVGPLACTQALAEQAVERYQHQQKEQPTCHREGISRYTRTCWTSLSSLQVPTTTPAVIRVGW